MEFIYEMHLTSEIDAVYCITEAFELLEWAPILSLPHHIYPNLVREFYANIDNKKGYSGEEIRSFVRGRQFIITRVTIAQILKYNNQGSVINLKKVFILPNKH